jgi:hypothetical protein
MHLLVEKHDFSEARVRSQLKNLMKEKEEKKQKSLADF